MKSITIEQLAELLNGNLWVKGDLKRIYLDCGYNTKKMTTKTYVYEKDARFVVICKIECHSQDPNWIYSQQQEVITSLNTRIEELIEEFGTEIIDPLIAINESLAKETQVKGYTLVWKEVRIPINSYGKLAYRKRMFINTYNGPESKKPYGFIELNDADYEIALQKQSKQIGYEYGNEPNLIGESERIAADKLIKEAKEMQESENNNMMAAKVEQDKKNANEKIAAKLQELKEQGVTNPLLLWKLAGCIQPAPSEVVQAKNDSGLTWKLFINSIGL